MTTIAILLTWAALGQAATEPAAAAADGEPGLVNVEQLPQPIALELIESALKDISGSGLAGRPVSLVEALSAGSNPGRRADAIKAYWRTSRALAELRLATESLERLETLAASADSPEATSPLAAALASAKARRHAIEADAIAAQEELAVAIGRPLGAPLPLPTDQPHVGSYQTRLSRAFLAGPPPARAVALDRLLPPRQQAVQASAAAVQAARDAREATEEAYANREADLESVLRCHERAARQEEAFLAAVLEYNGTIADYALLVAREGYSPQRLVSMLIKPRSGLVAGGPLSNSGGVLQAGFDDRRDFDPASGSGLRRSGIPTLATPPSDEIDADGDDATANDADETDSADGDASAAAFEPVPDRVSTPERSVHSLDWRGYDDRRRTVRRVRFDDATAPQDGGPTASLYAGLASAEPSAQAVQLAELLSWNPTHQVSGANEPELANRLRGTPIAAHRATVAAYWLVREIKARRQALTNAQEQLAAIAPAALDWRNEPGGAAEMLRLHAARQTVLAKLAAANAELTAAQLEWGRITGRDGQAADVESATPFLADHAVGVPPLGGASRTEASNAPPPAKAGTPTSRHAALRAALVEAAAAVVAGDDARASRQEDYLAGNGPLDPVLEWSDRTTADSFTFLALVSEYNRSLR